VSGLELQKQPSLSANLCPTITDPMDKTLMTIANETGTIFSEAKIIVSVFVKMICDTPTIVAIH
jgi:hypothetical protein